MNALSDIRPESNLALKLNPPETAPKEPVVILAAFDFGSRQESALYPAMWNPLKDSWCVALFVYGDDRAGREYVSPEGNHINRKLLGWLPIPRFDKYGNLFCR